MHGAYIQAVNFRSVSWEQGSGAYIQGVHFAFSDVGKQGSAELHIQGVHFRLVFWERRFWFNIFREITYWKVCWEQGSSKLTYRVFTFVQ